MEKVDVFVRCFRFKLHTLQEELRGHMREVVRVRWVMQRDANVEPIIGDAKNFHMRSKWAAEENAHTPIYVIADDDCLILGKDFIKNGIAIMKGHKDFGMIGAWNITDDPLLAAIGQTLVEKECGGVVFVRKGILTEFQDTGVDHVDGSLSDEMHRKGYKVGVSTMMRFNHLGSGYSTSTKGCWEA